MLITSVFIQAQPQWICGTEFTEDSISEFLHPEMTCTGNSSAYDLYYSQKEFWMPDANTPVKTLHINFNIWQRADGTGNVQNNPTGISRLENIAG